jgi:hypothetical protein
MKLTCPLSQELVIPAQAGIQRKNTPRSEQNHDVDPLRGNFIMIWIPACAGMTLLMDYLG